MLVCSNFYYIMPVKNALTLYPYHPHLPNILTYHYRWLIAKPNRAHFPTIHSSTVRAVPMLAAFALERWARVVEAWCACTCFSLLPSRERVQRRASSRHRGSLAGR